MSEQETRLYFVDYLRAAIISLVVLHHLAITYGGSGSWYYIEPATDATAVGLFSLFTAFNQAWFMGLLFLLSGYFSPSSFDRKGPKRFLKDRLIRLFIPLLIFTFVLNPITLYIATFRLSAGQLARQGYKSNLTLTWQSYLSAVGQGPLWFVEMLLIFDIIYLIWRIFPRSSTASQVQNRPFPSYRTITVFILILAAVAYLLRIVIPIDFSIFGFPSLFDLPQYASFFIIGLVAARRDWLRKMPSTMAKRVFGFSVIATFTLFLLAVIGTEDSSLGWGSIYGYGSLSSAFFALWESIFSVGISMLIIAFFRHYFNSAGKLWKYLSEHSYTVYIIQPPTIVTVSTIILFSVQIESLLKFFLAAIITIPLVWAMAYPVRKIPFANRVL